MRVSRMILATIPTALLVLMFVAGCTAAPEVRVDQDAAADMSTYRTFGFYHRLDADKQAYSTLTTSRIKEATIRELERLGYRLDELKPDLLVNFSANISDRQEVTKTLATVGGFYGLRPAAVWARNGYAYDIDVRQFKAGTLIIDLIDAGQKRLVWRGVAEGELRKSDQKDPAATIDRAVTGIFAKFTAS